MRRAALAVATTLWMGAAPPLAQASTPHVRVIVVRTPVHSGPDGTYRILDHVQRGDTFVVVERARGAYWFKVELHDGTTGWLRGDAVFSDDDDGEADRGFWGRLGAAIFGPSPIGRASTEISFSAGVLGHDGLYLLRPAWIVDPRVALEAWFGISPRAEKDILVAGGGLTLRLAPGAPIAPFAHIGFGAGHDRPKADNFVDEADTLFALSAGGGFEATLKKQITLRLDARRWTFFDPDHAASSLELSAGLAVFF